MGEPLDHPGGVPVHESDLPTLIRVGLAQAHFETIHPILEHLFRNPAVNVKRVEEVTRLSQHASNALTSAMKKTGVLREMTGRKAYRVFGFERYRQLFQEREERG